MTCPSIPDARRSVGARILRNAIGAYHAAVRRHKRLKAAAGDGSRDGIDNALEKWACLAWEDEVNATTHLLRAVLAWHRKSSGGIKGNYRAETKKWPTCGVSYQGRVYLAVPADDIADIMEDGDEGKNDVMKLVVLSGKDVTGIDVEEIEPK